MSTRPGEAMPLTDEETLEIVGMLKTNHSHDQIVDWIGCSYSQISRIAGEHGLKRPRGLRPKQVRAR